MIAEPTLMSHTVYRPADLSPFTGARRLPIIAWGNGACSNAGLLFQTFLTQIASHGFVAIASGPKDAPLPAFASQVPGQATSTPNAAAGIAAAARRMRTDQGRSTGRSPRTAAAAARTSAASIRRRSR